MEKSQLLIFANIAAITYEDQKTSKTKFKTLGYTIVIFLTLKMHKHIYSKAVMAHMC